MATARNGRAQHARIAPGNDAEALDADLFDRLLASAAGLPRVCVLRRCRRRKRCLGPRVGGNLPCKRHHEGLARARFQSALKVLGWATRDGDGARKRRR